MNSILSQALITPWKVPLEVMSWVTTAATRLTAAIWGIKLGPASKFYGSPIFLRAANSQIRIGSRFENRNIYWSNPLGISQRSLFCTWLPGAEISIGNDVGLSGTVICASSRITIGSGTVIGANSTIIDSDFHPVVSSARRYSREGIGVKPVTIGENVFIGTRCLILKGVSIGNDSVIAAGSTVYTSVPAHSLYTTNGQIKSLK